MSREALRNVLLDLKSQMRGARASSYLKKEADVKPDEKPLEKKSGDSPKPKLEASKGSDKPDKEAKLEGPPDFQEEMKKFFNKKNVGRKRVSKVMGSDFESMAKKPEIIRKKGK